MRILQNLLQVIMTVNDGLGVCKYRKREDTVKIIFLHPNRPSPLYTHPTRPDILQVHRQDILMKVDLCMATGRT
jgi:hypothetical protein